MIIMICNDLSGNSIEMRKCEEKWLVELICESVPICIQYS